MLSKPDFGHDVLFPRRLCQQRERYYSAQLRANAGLSFVSHSLKFLTHHPFDPSTTASNDQRAGGGPMAVLSEALGCQFTTILQTLGWY